jgi:hypothetical protein
LQAAQLGLLPPPPTLLYEAASSNVLPLLLPPVGCRLCWPSMKPPPLPRSDALPAAPAAVGDPCAAFASFAAARGPRAGGRVLLLLLAALVLTA